MSRHQHQPSYDFLTGDSSTPPHGSSGRPPSRIARPSSSSSNALRQSLRASSASALNTESAIPQPSASAGAKTVEDLRARIRKLEYEASSQKQAAEMAALAAETELRDARTRADNEARKAREAERAVGEATRRAERLENETREKEEEWEQERQDSERRLRGGREQVSTLEEEMEELRGRNEELERVAGRKKGEEDGKFKQVKMEYERLLAEHENTVSAATMTQQKLAKSEEDIGRLEAEILDLKSRAGDAEMVEVLKRDLGEQVGHIRRLENLNRSQLAELGELRTQKRNVEVVEEQKRSLETRLRLMEELRTELDEVRMRNEMLESERKAWTAYFEAQSATDPDLRFDSPEELARAFVHERVERAALMDQLGTLQPELSVKDDNIRALEDDKATLQIELDTLKQSQSSSASVTDSKALTRVERQKNLAVKETEYLRAQLKALDVEEAETNPSGYNAEQAKRVTQLEGLVDEYRKEVSDLQKAITNVESQSTANGQLMPVLPSTPVRAGAKRNIEDSSSSTASPLNDERVGELLRKNRALQDTVSKLETRAKVLESDLKAKSSQLSTLKASSRVRILELKDNPTASAASIKKKELDALKAENDILKGQLAGSLPTVGEGNAALVPAASLTMLQLELQDHEATLASRDKSILRLKDVFRAKGLEFREAVASLLGWQLNFQPNGRVKATSMFYKDGDAYETSRSKRRKRRDEDKEDREEQFIEFDGEKGTMKVSGGPQSEFAKEIRGLIEFWVDAKGQIPCFLAAMTLEFYEKYGDNGNGK